RVDPRVAGVDLVDVRPGDDREAAHHPLSRAPDRGMMSRTPVKRPSRALSILILLALAPACRKPSVHSDVEPPTTTPPTAVVTMPVGTQTGIFSIGYVLSDPDG